MFARLITISDEINCQRLYNDKKNSNCVLNLINSVNLSIIFSTKSISVLVSDLPDLNPFTPVNHPTNYWHPANELSETEQCARKSKKSLVNRKWSVILN